MPFPMMYANDPALPLEFQGGFEVMPRPERRVQPLPQPVYQPAPRPVAVAQPQPSPRRIVPPVVSQETAPERPRTVLIPPPEDLGIDLPRNPIVIPDPDDLGIELK